MTAVHLALYYLDKPTPRWRVLCSDVQAARADEQRRASSKKDQKSAKGFLSTGQEAHEREMVTRR